MFLTLQSDQLWKSSRLLRLASMELIELAAYPFSITALWCWLPPAGGRPVLVRGASQKRAPDPKIGGFFWCTISGSVQKTVQCTVFSDRSPRGECKLHSSAARARPVGDGAPPTSLSATHNAKKDPQVYRLQVFTSWCTIGDSPAG